jgi:hypothetical protein
MHPPVDPRDAGPDPLTHASLRRVAFVATLAVLLPPLALFEPTRVGLLVALPALAAAAWRR